MLSIAIMLGIIGIITLFVYLAFTLPEDYMPLKLLFWLCIPLLINVGLFYCWRITLASFNDGTASVFEGLFVIGITLMIFIYIYMAGMAIFNFFKNMKHKKYLERMSKI